MLASLPSAGVCSNSTAESHTWQRPHACDSTQHLHKGVVMMEEYTQLSVMASMTRAQQDYSDLIMAVANALVQLQ